MRHGSIVLLPLIAACNLPRPADVGPPDTSPNAVVGHSVVTYVLPDGNAVMANEDLSGYKVQVYFPDANAASGYHVVDGSADSNGLVTVADVPVGVTFALKLEPPVGPDHRRPIPTFYVTDQRDLDLGYAQLGREGTVPITHPTPVSLSIANMSPWNGGTLVATSMSTGTARAFWTVDGTVNGPAQGAVAIANTTFDWSMDPTSTSPVSPRRIEAAHADDLAVEHAQSVVVIDDSGDTAGIHGTQLVDRAVLTNANMIDGSALSLNGSFSNIALDQSQTFRLFVMNPEAAAGCSGGGDGEFLRLERVAGPGVLYGIKGDPPVALYSFATQISPAARSHDGLAVTMHFGDPYPVTWSQMMMAEVDCFRLMATGAVIDSGAVTAQAPGLGHDNFQVYVGGPTEVAVNGASGDKGGALAFDGTRPIAVTWQAATSATEYEVEVLHGESDTLEGPIAVTVARFETAGTSIVVPADLFTIGDFYAFVVTARKNPAQFAAGHLRASGFPWGETFVATGSFRISAVCGNGKIDPGEDCDDSGDSSECDSDCTKATCGDGYLNSTAGEICDWFIPGPCDRDCTAVTCGDGTWNRTYEECDDGNATDEGNGCSTQCTLNKCGDGVLQAPWEECDDGNTTSGDGCSSRCQHEIS